MDQVIATAVVAVVAIAGWWVVNAQQRRAVRRNMRIEYLLSAYRQLERVTNREPTKEHGRAIEEAVADVYLLGTPKQVELVADFAKNFAQAGGADLNNLLMDLRKSLRRELLLEADESDSVSLRIEDKS
jgi:hypothetical protein